MSKDTYEASVQRREEEEHEYNQRYRTEVIEPLEKQECIRRNIEALATAARNADMLGAEEAKTLKEAISKKMTAHVEALKPLS